MRRFIFLAVVAILLCSAYVRWKGGLRLPGEHRAEGYTPALESKVEVKDVPTLAAIDDEYVKLVKAVVPSIVSIKTQHHVQVLVDPFTLLFGGRRQPPERTESALGSGFIVSKEGHILTNFHVVANMDEIRVQLPDGRILPATVVGADEPVDIAVLRVDGPNMQPLPLGNSDDVQVGQMVLAVGNPFGFQESVTRGIVSAKERSLPDSGVEYLQTDAAVNPGNSGGPLLNLRGEVIGINSSIYSPTRASVGISFAIPANLARRSLESILKTGHSIRGYLGINTMPLNVPLAQHFGLNDLRGLVVTDVDHGSPAEQAGVKPGDVIRAFNGREFGDGDATKLRDLLAKEPIGTKVELNLLRNGKPETVTMEVAEMSVAGPAPADAAGGRKNPTVAGIEVSPLPKSLLQNNEGVAISKLQPDSPAAERLRIGDIVQYLNNRPIRTPADFERAASSLGPQERAVFVVIRGQERLLVWLDPRSA